MSIKPGPKRTNEDGTPDKRQRVTPEKQKDHPDLKPTSTKRGVREKQLSGAAFLFRLRANLPDCSRESSALRDRLGLF
jgi:hypothetical protein